MEVPSHLLSFAGPLLGVLIGGSFALLGTWLSDRRKVQNERDAMRRRERALLTGMFAVRNHIAARLQEYGADGVLFRLKALRTAQVYVHRLMEKAPGESEGLMIAIIDIGLKLDAVMATLETLPENDHPDVDLLSQLRVQIGELLASLDQFDLFTGSNLEFIDEETLAKFPQAHQAGLPE